MEKVRFGVLGAAKIAIEKVIPAMQRGQRTEVVAIASRDRQQASAAAAQLGLARSYGGYQELLDDPAIDAVYIPLPNHLHVEWAKNALAAGLHVLCEKPIGLSVAEAEDLVVAAHIHPKLKVMEAFMYRHHPQWQQAQRLVRSGRIGPLRAVQSFFSYFNDDPQNIRNIAEYGGGGLMDIGCYPISLSRFLFEDEPARVSGIVEYDPELQVDRLSSAMLDFGSGTATFTCSTQLAPYQRVNIFGTTGRIEIEIPFNAPPDIPCRMWLQQQQGQIEEIVLPVTDQYTIQGDLFAQAIQEETPVPTPIEDAVGNMRVIEAIVRSGKSGCWETP